jgi:hypothetical protein
VIARAIAPASETLLSLAAPMAGKTPIWQAALALSYGCELRAEGRARPAAIVAGDPARFARFAAAAVLAPIGAADAARRWRQLRRRGTLLGVARLLKASATYAGGIDYLADKIQRHSGATVIIRPWMRRLPLLAGIWLAPRLWRRGFR